MAATFDKCVVINLAKRTERLARFSDRIASVWPLATIERFSAVNGLYAVLPSAWKPSPGAYGAFLSHRMVIASSVELCCSTMIFEDDAVPRHDAWVSELHLFLQQVPDDWDMLYLGGQCGNRNGMPIHVHGDVWRPRKVNRAHAYAVSAKGAVKLLAYLNAENPMHNNHIDYQFQMFHQHPDRNMKPENNIYIPRRWFFGQGTGETDVSFNEGTSHRRRFWWW